jgi:PhzF family phenazine biosynthesis protein
MKTYTVYQVDSFTETPFQGNPAGVVLNADGLSENDMRNIARELNNSETAFFFSAKDDSCDGELRYFTPKTEVPTCGHATIAALYAKAAEENLGSCILRIRTKVGILQMEILECAGDYLVSMTQGKIEISDPLPASDVDELLAALKLAPSDLDEKCPIQIASTGHSKVLVGMKSRARMNDLCPDFEKLAALSGKIRCNGFFVFTFDTDRQDVLTEGRMFAPAIGINEDPVTGNANGPLGAYMIHNGLAHRDYGIFKFTGFQGEKMGRPGKITVEVSVAEGIPRKVMISGHARIVFRTEMSL